MSLSSGASGYGYIHWVHVFQDDFQAHFSGSPLVPSGFKIFHRPFGEMEEALQGEEVDGVLMDLGVSNNQAGTSRGLDPEAGSRWSMEMD